MFTRRSVGQLAVVALGFSMIVGAVAASQAGAVVPEAGTYVTLTPNRLLDTRTTVNGGIAPTGTLSLDVTGAGAIPTGRPSRGTH